MTVIVGVYGVIAYVSSQRTAEIRVRMALGSDAGGVRRTILLRGLRIALAGVALGIAAVDPATPVVGSGCSSRWPFSRR